MSLKSNLECRTWRPRAPRGLSWLAAGGALLMSAARCGEPAAAGAASREHRSPGGVLEKCVAGVRIPGGRYLAGDEEQEKRFCAIDFHAQTVALCPKMWSTSPATIVYDVRGGRFPNDAPRFESQSCPKGGSARGDALAELAMYKMSVNAAGSSGTFAPASLVYYHLSRYFHTEVQVPVSVYRTVDKDAHRRRVVEPALRYTARQGSLRMLHAGWRHMHDITNPAGTAPGNDEALTPDRQQLFGVLIYTDGIRYGPAVNGTRAGGWGAGQVRSMQKTPVFLALRQPKELREAIREGIQLARRDPAMNKAIGASPSDVQMSFWMREMSEIALLDFILGQQDRVGNIDYAEHWYWVKDGKVENRRAANRTAPRDLAPYRPVLLKRTWLNDNDAGVRSSYSDFAKQTGMLEGLSHFSATTYRQLIRLDGDLQARGELYRHLAANYALEAKELQLIAGRTRDAAALLRRACQEKRLRFDLEPEEFLLSGSVRSATPECDLP